MKTYRKYKKILILTIAINMIFVQPVFGASIPPDVLGKSYEKAVSTLFDKGIITGDQYGNFNPNQTLTRAQACVIVVKSMNPPIAEVVGTATQDALKSGFPDMSGYAWAEGYISYAVKKGITKGYPNGTFKPGNKVSSNELVTMILRGAGTFDNSLEGTWPNNYLNKAETLNFYENMPSKDSMPQYATKWIAAQMDYNGLNLIEKANPPEERAVYGVPKILPDFTLSKFVLAGSFDLNISKFAGFALAEDVQIYSYGEIKDYFSGMTLSEMTNDYLTDSLYKYKSVVTPAKYILENNKITSIILPKDVGYTGKIYCVINGTLKGLQTLTAAREMNWPLLPGMKNIPSAQNYSNGSLYKLNSLEGEIQSIEVVPDLTNGYNIVEDYKINGPVMITAGGNSNWIQISSTATIYIIDSTNASKYKVGSTANIKKGLQIKLFDVSADGETTADIVIIKE